MISYIVKEYHKGLAVNEILQYSQTHIYPITIGFAPRRLGHLRWVGGKVEPLPIVKANKFQVWFLEHSASQVKWEPTNQRFRK